MQQGKEIEAVAVSVEERVVPEQAEASRFRHKAPEQQKASVANEQEPVAVPERAEASRFPHEAPEQQKVAVANEQESVVIPSQEEILERGACDPLAMMVAVAMTQLKDNLKKERVEATPQTETLTPKEAVDDTTTPPRDVPSEILVVDHPAGPPPPPPKRRYHRRRSYEEDEEDMYYRYHYGLKRRRLTYNCPPTSPSDADDEEIRAMITAYSQPMPIAATISPGAAESRNPSPLQQQHFEQQPYPPRPHYATYLQTSTPYPHPRRHHLHQFTCQRYPPNSSHPYPAHFSQTPPSHPLLQYRSHSNRVHAVSTTTPTTTSKPPPYEEMVRTTGLPKNLSFRKICSKCGKSRSEHGNGFGNKCVFDECGKCGAGLAQHVAASQPMGILCQLTVAQGARRGAAEAYHHKLQELSARAHLQKELQRRDVPMV